MTQRTSPFLGAKYGWDYGESGWNSGMDENLLKFSYLFDKNIDGVVSTLPSAVDGLSYFLTTDNRLYFGVGTTWYSSPVPKWFILNNKVTGETFQFNGTALVSVASNADLNTRVTTLEGEFADLGTASTKDIEFFASQAQLDISEATSAQYTDQKVAELANTDGATKIGAAPSGTVQDFIDYINLSPVSRDSTTIAAAIAGGGHVVIGEGAYYVNTPMGLDYGNPALGVGFAGNPSGRYDIRGESRGGTILNNQTSDFCVTLDNSIAGQSVGGLDHFGNMTITGPSVTTPNTTGVGGSGLLVRNKSQTEISNLSIQNLALGLKLTNVLSSRVDGVDITGCYNGINAVADETQPFASAPNAIVWTGVRVTSSTNHAVYLESCTSAHFNQLTLEGNGVPATNSVGLYIKVLPGDIAGVINLTSFYSELNAGLADIYIDNTTTNPLVVNIIGGFFGRVSPTQYVTNNIKAVSSGGGSVRVNLIGCHFISSFGYTPSTSRLYWSMGANCELMYDDATYFSETTSLPRDKNFTTVKTAQFTTDGSFGGGASGLSGVKQATGQYLITSTKPLGSDGFGYNVIGSISGFSTNPTSTATGIRIVTLSTTQFIVFTFAGTTAVDSYFSVNISKFY